MHGQLKETLMDKLITLTTVLGKNTITLLNPEYGPVIGEILSMLIPNHRIERIAKYVETLDQKVAAIPVDEMRKLLHNENVIDLLEEGFIQASRSTSDERREFISTLVTNGISDEHAEYVETKSVLRLLGEINDVEVLWLRYYSSYFTEEFKNFREKHKDVLTPVRVSTNSDDEVHRKEALQKYYCQHLERLNLLEFTYPLDNPLKSNDLSSRNVRKPNGYQITKLGKVLLKHIGLIDHISERTRRRTP